MRLALAQLNPIVGDLAGNAALIAQAAERARAAGADVLVAPELALCGYPPKDLLLSEGFVGECARHARELGQRHSSKLTLVFGCPLPVDPGDLSKQGSAIANALLAYRDGQLIASYDKRLLPTYDVFDEDRYFVDGDKPVVIDVPTSSGRSWRVGLSICEDLWRGQDVGFAHRYASKPDPVAELCEVQPDGGAGAQLIINPSASPFVLGKTQRHRDLLRRHATQRGVFVAAVNQLGGNDDLIFDGHSCVFDPRGSLIAAGPQFRDHLLVADLEKPAAAGSTPLPENAELLYQALVLGIRDYCRKTGFSSVVLGLSGGIDSAVTCVLAAAALGAQNVLGVSLPSRYSSQGSRDDAAELAKRLGVRMITVPIEGPFSAMLEALAPSFADRPSDVTEENLQSRCRGTLLMAISNKFGHLLLTTGNKSEMAVGYATLYGDMNGGLAVLSDVSKHWVYELARWMNAHPRKLGISGSAEPPIPESSITKPPSAELRPNQTDQDSLPPYPVLDEILIRYVERHQHPRTIVQETGFDAKVVARVARLIDVSEFKRKQAAIGLKVTGVAFGAGRRFPIAQGYRPDRTV